jgi:hypothetical protein
MHFKKCAEKFNIFSIHNSLDIDGGSNTDVAYYAALFWTQNN